MENDLQVLKMSNRPLFEIAKDLSIRTESLNRTK